MSSRNSGNRRIPLVFIAIFLFLRPSFGWAHGGTPIGNGFSLERVVGGLDLGVGFATTSSGTILVAQKGGIVRVVQNGTLLAEPFIDLSAEVNNTNDRGLLGIAVHPTFPAEPYVYLLYTYDPPQAGSSGMSGRDGTGARVARLLRVNADPASQYRVADLTTAQVLLGSQSTWANIGNPSGRNDYSTLSCGNLGNYTRDCLPADELSHTIGTVAFGPDGMLYVGNGDGCDYTRVQDACTRSLDVDSLAGKIMRIDPISGDAPNDNPFFDGDPQSNRSKVFQLGLRNPFRFSFDEQTGDLYVGDVGWNTWEEINRGEPGANFGWPCYEGGSGTNVAQPQYIDLTRCDLLQQSGELVSPAIYAYTHASTSSSVQVGDLYRGTDYPAEYQGALFYSDYNKQSLRALTFDGNGSVMESLTLATGISGITQMSSDPLTQEMLILRISTGGAGATSAIERLHYDPPEPSTVPEGAYTMLSEHNGGCIESFPETRFWIWVTSPARIETATCSDSSAQEWHLEELGDGSYLIRSESEGTAMSASGTAIVPTSASGSTAQRFRPVVASNGFQLRSEQTGNCVVALGSSVASELGLAACEDAPAQRFVLRPEGNLPPTIQPIADVQANVDEDVALSVSASDPEGAALEFSASGLPPGLLINHATGDITGVVTAQGHYGVTVVVSDGFSQATTAFDFVVVDDRVPVVLLSDPPAGLVYRPGDTLLFAAEALDWQGTPLPGASLSWELFQHHQQHVHFDGLPATTGLSGTYVASDHGDNTWLEFCVTATDGAGRQATSCRDVYPEEVDYTIETVPSGLTIPWEGVSYVTPFTVRTHVGSVRDLSAPLMQGSYEFAAWSDGGAASHPIEVGASPQTFVATYDQAGPVPGTYRLRAEHSSKCLEYRSARYFWVWEIEAARFAQYPCGASAQALTVGLNGDGSFSLVSSGGTLTVASGSTNSGAAIVPANDTGAASQRWRIEPAPSGYAVRNVGSDLCLAVSNASTADGASYIQAACGGGASQRFTLEAP